MNSHDNSLHLPMKLMRHEEIVLPPFMLPEPEEKLRFIKDLPHVAGDVILVTYSKSGTAWVSHLLGQLLKTEKDAVERPIGRLLETAPPGATLALDPPRIMTTHLRPRRLPRFFCENKGKVILLLRNPKDVAVSYYFHLKKSILFSSQQTWDEYFQSYVDGNVPYGQFFDFLDEWDNVVKGSFDGGSGGMNIEVFYYEDLKLNPIDNLRRLSQFLGCEKTDEELNDIHKACSIENLRAKAQMEKDKLPKGQRDKDGNSVIYRKGEVGDWKNYFTVAQNEFYDSLAKTRLSDSSFKFVYEI